MLLVEIAPQLFACRSCEAVVEDELVAVLAHYLQEHPAGTSAVIVSTVGLVVLVGTASASPRSRR